VLIKKLILLPNILKLLSCYLLLSFGLLSADELIIISPHWDGMKQEVKNGFAQWIKKNGHQPIALRFLDVGGGSDIIKYVTNQFNTSPDTIDIDLIWGGGTDPFIELDDHNLLMTDIRLPTETLEAIPKNLHGSPLRADNNSWFAVNLSAFGILYNKKILNMLNMANPTAWSSLARPEAFSWVASADPRKSASSHVIYEIILQAYGWDEGWDILQGLAANTRVFSSSSAQTPHDVAVGEVAYGFVIDSYGLAAVERAGSDTLGFMIPENLTALSGDCVGILKGAPHKRTAELFIQYLLSIEGQTLLMAKKSFEGGPLQHSLNKMSVRAELYEKLKGHTSIDINPFAWKNVFNYNFAKAAHRWGVINDLVGIFLIEGAPYLRQLRKKQLTDKIKHTLFHAPISEEEAHQIATQEILLQPGKRVKELMRWRKKIPGTNSETSSILLFLAPTFLLLVTCYNLFGIIKKNRQYTSKDVP
jgi:ABC-type Fe3+ transport system substrate-binding protein